jgi:hypothetical protein
MMYVPSQSHILLELIELVGQQREVAIEVLGVGHDSVDLVGKPHVLRLLRHQVVLSTETGMYIFYSKIFTSIISFVFDYSVVCLPYFSTDWNYPVRALRVPISCVRVAFNFLVWT